ncbi:hypothetical protein CRENBAI_004045 [Crenichthys baileyi]|uniref:Uncharacterized protein n=1 Tax=Crenichthys baileyi TaxID=28760 RepID=A0AAV9SEY0_9TELE
MRLLYLLHKQLRSSVHAGLRLDGTMPDHLTYCQTHVFHATWKAGTHFDAIFLFLHSHSFHTKKKKRRRKKKKNNNNRKGPSPRTPGPWSGALCLRGVFLAQGGAPDARGHEDCWPVSPLIASSAPCTAW